MDIILDINAAEDLTYWVKEDRKKAHKILSLIKELAKDPFGGSGKPEPLRYALAGCWSRRIDQEHRLVYTASNNSIRILSCRYHYG